jgi:signal transduction histidine kinase
MTGALITLDRERRVNGWSEGAARLTGWQAAEVVGRSIDELRADDDEESWLDRDGSQLALSDVTTELRDENGDLAGFAIHLRAPGDSQLLLGRLIESEEAERRRLAADLHDDSLQAIIATRMRLQILLDRFEGDDRLADDELSDLKQLDATVRAAIERMRRLLFDLRPAVLDSHGLGAAVNTHLDQLRAEEPVETRLIERTETELPHGRRAIAYRAIREALANVRKHARATQVEVTLHQDQDGLTATIADDGVGFDASDAALSEGRPRGLDFARERVEAAGGSFQIDSARGRGTTVELRVPAASDA